MFKGLKLLSEPELSGMLRDILRAEALMESDFREARTKLSDSEHQILGFEFYGEGGRHYAFTNILKSFGIDTRSTTQAKSSPGNQDQEPLDGDSLKPDIN
jgi:hypothetical protein